MTNIIIHHRSIHHAQNSGYGQLADYLEGEKLSYLSSKFPYKIAKGLASMVSNEYGNYDTMSVIKDYELSRKILKSKDKGIVHYLNGERDIRYSLQINRRQKNYKFIATFHKPPEVLVKNFNPKILKKLDGAIAVGENQVDFLKNWLNMDNVKYIPHGINTDFFVPNSTIKESNTILFAGQHLRDFETFNCAIPIIKQTIPNLKVNVVLRKDFASKIKPNSYTNIYSGIDDIQLRTLYQKATLLFIPLKNSTACNSILEAMACGLPIVSTNVGGNKGYVSEDYGKLVPLNNHEAIIDVTLKLLSNNKLISMMSEQAIKNSKKYDWKNIAKEVSLFYNSLLT